MNQLKIIYTDWGMANFYGGHIEINKALRNNKVLRDYIVRHELGHRKGFDLAHEFSFSMNNFKVMWFMLQHPKTWIDLSPLQIRKGRLIYDLNLTMMYGLVLGLVLFGRYLFF